MCEQALQVRRAFRCMPAIASRVLASATAYQDPPSVFGPGTAICVLFGRMVGACVQMVWQGAGGTPVSTFAQTPPLSLRATEQAVSTGCLYP